MQSILKIYEFLKNNDLSIAIDKINDLSLKIALSVCLV